MTTLQETLEAKLEEKGYIIVKELSKDTQKPTRTYLAKNKDKHVVIKVSSELLQALDKTPDTQQVKTHERETTILKQIQHPNIPKFLDDITFMIYDALPVNAAVIQYVPSPNLQEKIDEEKPLTENEVKNVLKYVLTALAYLQTHFKEPIHHRDIKPSNILFDGNKAHLIDFNVSRQAKEGAKTTMMIYNGGYYPPDAYSGKISTSQDLAALGNTIIAALYAKDIAVVRNEQGKTDFNSPIDLDDTETTTAFKLYLRRLASPRAGLRYQKANDALEDLLKLDKLPEKEILQLLGQTKRDKRLVELLNEIKTKDPQYALNVPDKVLETLDDDELLNFLERVYGKKEFKYSKPELVKQLWQPGDWVVSQGIENKTPVLKPGDKDLYVNGIREDGCVDLYNIPVWIHASKLLVTGKYRAIRSNVQYQYHDRADVRTPKVGELVQYIGMETVLAPHRMHVPLNTRGIIACLDSKRNAVIAWEAAEGCNSPLEYDYLVTDSSSRDYNKHRCTAKTSFTGGGITLVRKNPVNFAALKQKHYEQ